MVEVMSRCPVCGARVSVGAGAATPPHDNEERGGRCAGTGKPSK